MVAHLPVGERADRKCVHRFHPTIRAAAPDFPCRIEGGPRALRIDADRAWAEAPDFAMMDFRRIVQAQACQAKFGVATRAMHTGDGEQLPVGAGTAPKQRPGNRGPAEMATSRSVP